MTQTSIVRGWRGNQFPRAALGRPWASGDPRSTRPGAQSTHLRAGGADLAGTQEATSKSLGAWAPPQQCGASRLSQRPLLRGARPSWHQLRLSRRPRRLFGAHGTSWLRSRPEGTGLRLEMRPPLEGPPVESGMGLETSSAPCPRACPREVRWRSCWWSPTSQALPAGPAPCALGRGNHRRHAAVQPEGSARAGGSNTKGEPNLLLKGRSA